MIPSTSDIVRARWIVATLVRLAAAALMLHGAWILMRFAADVAQGWFVGVPARQWLNDYFIFGSPQRGMAGIRGVLSGVMGIPLFVAAEWIARRVVPVQPAGCPGCGYALVGVRDAKCPECGLAVTGEQIRRDETAP